MDGDENDLLSTNQFIKAPELDLDISSDASEEFRKFYKSEMSRVTESRLKESFDRLSLKNVNFDEDTDANSLLTTNKFSFDGKGSIEANDIQSTPKRYKREVVTLVSVDSRDRNKVLYPKASQFKIFLGKTFYNVKSVKLSRIEFPNTDAVINSTSNRIYWRNKEDIQDDIIENITQVYPVYNVTLRIGSYISSSLQNEISKKMSLIKRQNQLGTEFHYFDVKLDIDTDIVTFTSLILNSLDIDPLSVIKGSGLVTVDTSTPHNFRNGDTVYIVGAKALAGIPSSILNTPHVISLVGSFPTSTQFQFEVNIKAGETALGGGNTVNTGKLAPFQLLFGENENTVAQNLGFPLENSGQRIDTFIKKIEKIYLLQIVTMSPHGFSNTAEHVNQLCLVSGTGIGVDGNRVIYRILDANTFLIQFDNRINDTSSIGQIVFGSRFIEIASVSNFINDIVLIKTFSPHNFMFDDFGKPVTLYGTKTTPTIDGLHEVFGIISSTEFFIKETLLVGGGTDVSTPGDGGSIPRHDPLRTQTLPIAGITTGPITMLECIGHGLTVGQKVKFYNLRTLPSITEKNGGVFEVSSIPDSDHFTVSFATTSFDNLTLPNATIGTNIIEMSFPDHGFNNIVSIANHTIPGDVIIQTFLPHNLSTGDTIRVMETNCVPAINDGFEITVLTSDTFKITRGTSLVQAGTSGIIGMSHNFYIYGAKDVGGIKQDSINNQLLKVEKVIDKDTFTFEVASYATSGEQGGESNIYISSLQHGFSGVQTNTKNALLNRSINLEGENYAFICCPQLATMMNTGNVKDIFARVTLDQSPGNMVFNFLSNPKEFDVVPLDKLYELNFSVVYYNNTFYEFNDLDYSFVLEITEVIDTTEDFGYSSRRGIINAP
jgi:hypothetical protein